MKKLLKVLLIVLLGMNSLLAQSNDGAKKIDKLQKLNASYVFGGQVYNDNFIYNPGAAIEFSYGFILSDDVSIGFGSGYMGLDKESFIPVFIEAVGYHEKKGKLRYIKFQGGYSFAWSNPSETLDKYGINDGLFFDFGFGREWKINEKLSLNIQSSYRHQFATMDYAMSNQQNFRDVINYDMVVLSVGIVNR